MQKTPENPWPSDSDPVSVEEAFIEDVQTDESAAPADPLIGQVLDERFTVLEKIGAGGMGSVYKAIQAPLERVVALKILNLNQGAGRDDGFRKRFFLEASLTSKLTHPNTITVIDYGCTATGIFFIAMEYVSGPSLADLISEVGAVPWKRTLKIAQQICRSLREAHTLGVVHRDLKPANVMLLGEGGDQDVVKVLDFGLVKSFLPKEAGDETDLTKHGQLVGSPLYMAPEQATRHHADPRSDIYSLGVLLYELLSGKPPFMGRQHVDVIVKHVRQKPPPLTPIRDDLPIPDHVNDLVMRCLEKDPEKRFQSMDEVLAALHGSPSMSGEQSAPDITEIAPLKVSRRLAWKRWVAVAACVGLGVWFFAQRGPSTQQVRDTLKSTADELSAIAPSLIPGTPTVSGLERIKFRVQSEPSGARVSLKGKSLGKTPLEFDLPPNRDGAAKAELRFTLPGHHPMTVTTMGAGPEIILIQKLQPIQRSDL